MIEFAIQKPPKSLFPEIVPEKKMTHWQLESLSVWLTPLMRALICSSSDSGWQGGSIKMKRFVVTGANESDMSSDLAVKWWQDCSQIPVDADILARRSNNHLARCAKQNRRGSRIFTFWTLWGKIASSRATFSRASKNNSLHNWCVFYLKARARITCVHAAIRFVIQTEKKKMCVQNSWWGSDSKAEGEHFYTSQGCNICKMAAWNGRRFMKMIGLKAAIRRHRLQTSDTGRLKQN